MGSSPLARGLQAEAGLEGAAGRIIPARAGFTGAEAKSDAERPDHPRSRGVYSSPSTGPGRLTGSSPLARGLRPGSPRGSGLARIIPARAGFTYRASRSCGACADHPRSRGVYKTHRASNLMFAGSSPLARGLPRRAHRGRRGVRIIPARAGFTALSRPTSVGRRDHPRSRGVYPGGLGEHHADGRIIPARAGFTGSDDDSLFLGADHPRSRGVYEGVNPTSYITERIIPARAGFTACSHYQTGYP